MKVIVNGALGKMGIEITRLVCEHYCNASLAAMVDINAGNEDNLFSSLMEYDGSADVIIDFSHHTAVKELLPYAIERKIPVVIATTGHDAEEKAMIEEAAKKIPVFFSANMSLGIATLCSFVKTAAKLFPDADIEIVEKHHVNKLDAPSGTALMLADSVCQVRPDAYVYSGRSGMRKRDKNEIGISALRLANVVGEHEVIIATGTQTLTLKHEAHSRSLFAEGAVAAAAFIVGKRAGLYAISDMVAQ